MLWADRAGARFGSLGHGDARQMGRRGARVAAMTITLTLTLTLTPTLALTLPLTPTLPRRASGGSAAPRHGSPTRPYNPLSTPTPNSNLNPDPDPSPDPGPNPNPNPTPTLTLPLPLTRITNSPIADVLLVWARADVDKGGVRGFLI